MNREKKEFAFKFVLISVILFTLNLLLHLKFFIGDRVLYSDELQGFLDIYTNSNLSFWNKIFGNDVLRPIPRLIVFVLFNICHGNYNLISYVLLTNNFIISFMVFYISYYIQSRNNNETLKLTLSGIAGVLYLFSRFMQCQIFSSLGIMEGLAHFSTLMVLYFFIKLLRENKTKYFYYSIIFWVISFYSHERYFSVLLPLLVIIFISKISKKHIIPVAIISVSYCIQRKILLVDSLRGTYHSSLSDTFNFTTFIKNIIKQVLYIMGINAGPAIKNGINYRDVPISIDIFIAITGICSIAVIIISTKHIIKNKQNDILKENILILTLMISCMAASSLVEVIAVRFVYVSYSLFLILIVNNASYIYGFLNLKVKKAVFITGTAAILLSSCIVETFYRRNISNVLFYNNKTFVESLYKVTVKEYGKALESKNIIIVNNIFNWKEKSYIRFFQPYVDSSEIGITICDSILNLTKKDFKNNIVIYVDDKTYLCTELHYK